MEEITLKKENLIYSLNLLLSLWEESKIETIKLWIKDLQEE